MTIIKPEPNERGQCLIETQSHRTEVWMDGYVEVPDILRDEVAACLGYCDLTIENGALVGIVLRDVPPPDPPPSGDPQVYRIAELEQKIAEMQQQIEELTGALR